MRHHRTDLLTIRELVAEDQPFLWDALYIALWDPPDQPRRPRSTLAEPHVAAYAKDWGSVQTDLGFAAIDRDGTAVGAVWSRLLRPPLGGGAFLNEDTPQLGIAVIEAVQGCGVGWRLMSAYLAGEASRFPAVSLGVHPENAAAIALYHRAGFVQYATGIKGYLHMVRRFAPPVPPSM